MSNCFNPANILLPKDGIDMEKWSVIACDQYTSQADYWKSLWVMHHRHSMWYFRRYIWGIRRMTRTVHVKMAVVRMIIQQCMHQCQTQSVLLVLILRWRNTYQMVLYNRWLQKDMYSWSAPQSQESV